MKRFFDKVSSPNSRGCRLWKGCVGADGYGHFRLQGKVVAAHRVAFFLQHAHWPEHQARHECDTPLCCEGAHLLDGTHKQNMEDCAARRRNRTPRPGNGYRKLSGVTVQIIRSRFAAGETNKSALAREYGVTPTCVRKVING